MDPNELRRGPKRHNLLQTQPYEGSQHGLKVHHPPRPSTHPPNTHTNHYARLATAFYSARAHFPGLERQPVAPGVVVSQATAVAPRLARKLRCSLRRFRTDFDPDAGALPRVGVALSALEAELDEASPRAYATESKDAIKHLRNQVSSKANV